MDLWNDAYRKVSKTLRDACLMLESWAADVAQLTGVFWPSMGAWKSGTFKDEVISWLRTRMSDVLEMRAVVHQLSSLLPQAELQELKVDRVFDFFSQLNALHSSLFAQPAWEAATASFREVMTPIEQRVARTLSKRFSSSGLKGHALLREFMRFRELATRESVFRDLAPARESLLGQLEHDLEVLREDFEVRSGQANGKGQRVGKNLPAAVEQIVLARQVADKGGEALQSAKVMLSDLQGMERFETKASDLLQYMNDFQQQYFSDWVRNVEDDLKDPSSGLALQLTGKLMEINQDDLSLQVNYSDRLILFLREVRQLSALGFKMPDAVKWNADVAHKFYRHGVVLKQVANFYNTIEKQIVRSQKPLLLDYAHQFEKLATNPTAKAGERGGGKTITWSDPNELERYIQHLHAAAERLTQENRKLRQVHTQMGEQVLELMQVSLLKQQSKWKDKVEALRGMADALQPNYPSMKGWRLHWDMQLFKALEHQYQVGLEGLHQDLPQIRCELEFKGRRLQLRPSLEDLRMEFYREIKKFISIPTGFKGLGYFDETPKEGENAGQGVKALGKHKVYKVFRDMPDRNVESLLVVYQKASELFAKLESEVLLKYRKYVVLGMYDGSLEDLVEERVSEAAEYDAAYKNLRQRRKEAEKLPNFQKVDCVNVSLAPLKAALEDQHQRLSNALQLGMARGASATQRNLDTFITESLETLAKRPQSVDEISEAKAEARRIEQECAVQKLGFKKLEDLSRLLATYSRAPIELGPLAARWEELELTLAAFNERIEDQIDHLRSQMGERVGELQARLEKFSARWFELKPKKLDTGQREEMDAVIERVKGWQSEFSELEELAKKLTLDCEHFGLAEPQLGGLDDLRADIESYVASCALFEQYTKELDELAKEDWISFRQRLWVFEDFVAAWVEKSTQCPPGAVADHLKTQLNLYRDLAPGLKNVRGDSFQPEHWRSLFHKLGIEKVALAQLCLHHFLGAAEAIVEHAEDLRTLNARALGEVAIREAIQEVSAWSQEAAFSTMDHEENGRKTPLIKDWKDMTTQVSDLQSLLGSLKDSPFFAAFADTVSQYESKLALLDAVLAQLNPIQRKWVYLEPIFGRGALPHEQARFSRVDEEFRGIMLGVGDDPRVFSLLRVPQLSESLEAILDQLERCQKALADFLEQKRQACLLPSLTPRHLASSPLLPASLPASPPDHLPPPPHRSPFIPHPACSAPLAGVPALLFHRR